jgi:hypothetical protein
MLLLISYQTAKVRCQNNHFEMKYPSFSVQLPDLFCKCSIIKKNAGKVSGIVKAGIPEIQNTPANLNSRSSFVMVRIQIEASVETIDGFTPLMGFLLQQAFQKPEPGQCFPFDGG